MEGAFLDPGLYLQEFGHRGMQPSPSIPAGSGRAQPAATLGGPVEPQPGSRQPEALADGGDAMGPVQSPGSAAHSPRTGRFCSGFGLCRASSAEVLSCLSHVQSLSWCQSVRLRTPSHNMHLPAMSWWGSCRTPQLLQERLP